MSTETTAAAGSAAAPTATAFDLRVHFAGVFVFSLKTRENSSEPGAKITGVEAYVPVCEHVSAASINGGATYMLENYWHCIDVNHDASHTPAGLSISQLWTNIGSNTPWTPGNRPIGGNWGVAFNLPIPPDDWQCGSLASASSPATGPCFSGRDAGIVPDVVALEHVLTYKQVSAVNFHGACFTTDFTPPAGATATDLYIISEVPYIPTPQHERRAADALAGLLGLDLVLNASIGNVTQAVGTFQPKSHVGNCLMSVVSGPKPA
jgi:hypothetical protein